MLASLLKVRLTMWGPKHAKIGKETCITEKHQNKHLCLNEGFGILVYHFVVDWFTIKGHNSDVIF